jgi:hypothetical protein
VESVGRDLIRELPSLSKGQVIVSGASLNTPVLLRVRQRITRHGGQDVDAPAEWFRWFEEDRAALDQRDNAIIVERQLQREEDGDVLFAA